MDSPQHHIDVAVTDLPEIARRLLRTILQWYNGAQVGDRHIATNRPHRWANDYQFAVAALADQGIVHTERVLGTEIQWALTPLGRRLLDDVPSVDLVGDPNASLRHRTGVAIVTHWLRHHREDTPADATVAYPDTPDDRRVDVRSWSD